MTFLLASVLEPRANREGEGSEIPEYLWALPNFSPLFLGSGVVDLWLKGSNMEPVCLALLFIRNDACMSPSPPPSFGPSLTAYQLQHSREPGHTFPTASSDLSPPSSNWDETRFCPEFPLPAAPFPGSTSCRFLIQAQAQLPSTNPQNSIKMLVLLDTVVHACNSST